MRAVKSKIDGFYSVLNSQLSSIIDSDFEKLETVQQADTFYISQADQKKLEREQQKIIDDLESLESKV